MRTPTNKSTGLLTVAADQQITKGPTIVSGVMLLSNKTTNCQLYLVDDDDNNETPIKLQLYMDGTLDGVYHKLPDIRFYVGLNVSVVGTGSAAVVYYR